MDEQTPSDWLIGIRAKIAEAFDSPTPKQAAAIESWICNSMEIFNNQYSACTELQDSNLELTRQVEQLRARVSELEQALHKDPSVTPLEDGSTDFYWSGPIRRLLNVRADFTFGYATRVTAPPSSAPTDTGRADATTEKNDG